MIIVPYVPEIDSIESLKNNLGLLGGLVDTSCILEGNTCNYNTGWKPMVVATFIKIVIASVLCNELKKRNMDFNLKYTVLEEDISFLSEGLSYKDIGKEVGIKELLNLILLASDNSAMYFVIKLLGSNKIENYLENFNYEHKYHFSSKTIPTKKLYGEAWKIKDNNHYNFQDCIDIVKWNNGFDYFFPLRLINEITNELNKFEWLPYIKEVQLLGFFQQWGPLEIKKMIGFYHLC